MVLRSTNYNTGTVNVFLRFLFVLLLFGLTGQLTAQEAPDIHQVRKQFYAAIEQEDSAEALYSKLQSALGLRADKQGAVLYAYYGAAETLLGKHAFNPYNKWKYLQSGLSKLQTAISKQPDNIEIRFLRFSILHYIPSFLGYGKERESDLETLYRLFISRAPSDLPSSIYKGAVEFVIKSDRLTKSQNTELQKLLTITNRP